MFACLQVLFYDQSSDKNYINNITQDHVRLRRLDVDDDSLDTGICTNLARLEIILRILTFR